MFKRIITVGFIASLAVSVGCKGAEEDKPSSPTTQGAQQPASVAPPSPSFSAPTVKASAPYEVKSVLAWSEEGLKESVFLKLSTQPQTCEELQASWRSKEKPAVKAGASSSLTMTVRLQRRLLSSGAREWRADQLMGEVKGSWIGQVMQGDEAPRVALEGEGAPSGGMLKGVLTDPVSYGASTEEKGFSAVGPFVALACGERPRPKASALQARPPGMTWEIAGLSLPVQGLVLHIKEGEWTWVVSDEPLDCTVSSGDSGPHALISMTTDASSVHQGSATLAGRILGPLTVFQVEGLTFSPVDLSVEQPTVSISGSAMVDDYPVRFTGSTTALICR